MQVAVIALWATGAGAFPEVLEVSDRRSPPEWPSESAFVLLHLRQDPESHAVTVRAIESSHPGLEGVAIDYVSNWQYGPVPNEAPEAPEGRLLIVRNLGGRSVDVPDLEPPKHKSRKPPTYPKVLASMGLDGPVTTRILVLPDGKVGSVSLINCAHPEFGVAAVQAIANWTFHPATFRGEPVAYVFRFTIEFALEGPGRVVVGGNPFEASDREELQRLGTRALTRPTIQRFALPPYPAEMGNRRRPTTMEFSLLINARGDIVGLNTDRVNADWRTHVETILKTWKFTPARIGDRRVPWLVTFRTQIPEPYPDVLLDAFRRGNVPRAESVEHPPRLLAEVNLPFTTETAPPQGLLYAEIDLLVTQTGIVAATQVIETNHPDFATFMRNRAAYNIYSASTPRHFRPPVWIRQRFEASVAQPDSSNER